MPFLNPISRLGLAGRIIAGLAVGLVAVSFLFGFLAMAAVQQSKDQVLQQRLALSKTMAGHIDYTLGRILRQLEDMAGRTPVDRDNHTLNDERQLLVDTYQNLGAFASMEFVDRDGAVIWTEPSLTEAFGSNAGTLPHIQRVFQTGSISIDLATPATPGALPAVDISVPLWSRGEVVGIVVGKLSLPRMGLDSVPAPNLGPTGRAELIAGTGLVIASSDRGSSGAFVDHVSVLKDLLERQQAGITLHKMPEGSTRPDHIVAYAPMKTLPWGIVVEQDQDEALALPQELQTRMALSGLIAMLAAGAIAWAAVRRLVVPLRTLTLAAQQIASGDLDQPLRIERSDEIGALARSFEAMRLKLRSSLDEIRRWNEELERRVEDRTREVQQLLAKVITVQEEERKRLARELHDESAQALTALIMSIQAAQDALPEGLDKEKKRLASTKAQAIHALVEMRQMILDLRPTALDDLGLIPAIRWYSETHLQPLGTQSSIETGGIRRRLPAEMETSLFRIFQEAINNIAKHSHAKKASIRLDVQEKEIKCTVEDDGIGFDESTYQARQGSHQGLGLQGMRERVSLLGGTLTIDSTQGKGTRLRVTIPLNGG